MVTRILFALLCLSITAPVLADPCSSPADPGYDFCYENPNNAAPTPRIQIDYDYETALVNGRRVAHLSLSFKFKCNGTLFYNSTGTCDMTGCDGINLGSGEVEREIGTVYTDSAQMPQVTCYTNDSDGWAAQSILPWDTNIAVVSCFNDTHCPACGEYCPTSSSDTSTWACGPRPDICNGVDDDCDASTPDGAAETWVGDACDGNDLDFCTDGTLQCIGGNQTCTDDAASIPDLCNGQDDDCNPNSPDGSDETWLNQGCDGDDADSCEDGTYLCQGGSQICTDDATAGVDLCNGRDDDCDPTTPDGSAESWYGDACDGADSDLCEEGTLVCAGVSGASMCNDTTSDDVEVCDGDDNDCDNATDEDFPDFNNNNIADCVDPDDDGDGVPDDGDGSGTEGDNPCASAASGCDDNCPFVANPDQTDTDGDGFGDACDDDDDNDGVDDGDDNCALVSNAGQENFDTDGEGDACDTDDDNDGVSDDDEIALDLDPLNPDSDGDTISDGEEVGPDPQNPLNSDDDPTIDALDTDSDADGIPDAEEAGDADLDTPAVNSDTDDLPDYRDPDSDGDGVLDATDNCRTTSNPGQENVDSDDQGDACDNDADNDGVSDADELALDLDPLNPDSDGDTISDGEEVGDDPQNPHDTDGDDIIDALDTDSDADGIDDIDEAGDDDLSTAAVDTDNDTMPDYRDSDSDDDSVVDGGDNCRIVANTDQADADGNGEGDLCDGDADGDGIDNENDTCELIANPDQTDTDGDGDGDVCDDSDGDGFADDVDNCDDVANPEQTDTDGDGEGDACDADDDNDTIEDAVDNCVLIANIDQSDQDRDGAGDLCDATPLLPPVGGSAEEDCACTSVQRSRSSLPAGAALLFLVGLGWMRRSRRSA